MYLLKSGLNKLDIDENHKKISHVPYEQIYKDTDRAYALCSI